jgi:hypothetical protein
MSQIIVFVLICLLAEKARVSNMKVAQTWTG